MPVKATCKQAARHMSKAFYFAAASASHEKTVRLSVTQISYRLWSRDAWCTTNFQCQRVKVIACIKKRYTSGTDKLSKVTLGENYPRAERNKYRIAMFKVIRSNTEIAITPLRIARLRSNLVQISSRHRRNAAYVQCQRLKVKVRA